MDWKQLESYVTVVRCCSFTKAAEELYISQPTISAHIQALEKEFNTKLILRTTKSVEVTPHGWKVYEFAKDVLEQQKVLCHRLQENLAQELRIGAFTVPLAYMMPGVLREFRERYPDVRVYMEQNDSRTVVSKLLYDQYDLGIISFDPGETRLNAIPFYRDRLVMITPDNDFYRAQQKAPDWKTVVNSSSVILRDAEHGNKKVADSMWKVIGFEEAGLNVVSRTDNLMAICSMVAEGEGIAMISELAARRSGLADRFLTFCLPGEEAFHDIYLVYKKDYVPKLNQQELVDYLLTKYRDTLK